MVGIIPGENILIKEKKNIQRVTNSPMRPEREQNQDSGKKIVLGGKQRLIKIYICVYMYVSDRKHSIKRGRLGMRDAGAAVVSGRFVTEWGWAI